MISQMINKMIIKIINKLITIYNKRNKENQIYLFKKYSENEINKNKAKEFFAPFKQYSGLNSRSISDTIYKIDIKTIIVK